MMTWAEFLIRLNGWRRKDKNDWFKVREIAWSALIGSHVDPKKLPSTKEAFMDLDGSVKDINEELMRDRILQAQEKYRNEVKKSNGE